MACVILIKQKKNDILKHRIADVLFLFNIFNHYWSFEVTIKNLVRKIFNRIIRKTFVSSRMELFIMTKKSVKSLPDGLGINTEERKEKIVVSLTTFPKRIESAGIIISLIMQQTMKADKILLYLSQEEFPRGMCGLPKIIKEEIKKGLTVVFVEGNLRSHKKYFYAIKEFPNDIVITVDDDILYPKNLIETLISRHNKFPDAVIANAAHSLLKNGEPINEYRDLDEAKETEMPKHCYQALGAGGILYPPHCMHKEIFNRDFVIKNCLTSDDIWLKAMQLMNRTPVLTTNTCKLLYTPCSQEIALWKTNCEGNEPQNIKNFENIYSQYNTYFGQSDTLLSRLMD